MTVQLCLSPKKGHWSEERLALMVCVGVQVVQVVHPILACNLGVHQSSDCHLDLCFALSDKFYRLDSAQRQTTRFAKAGPVFCVP